MFEEDTELAFDYAIVVIEHDDVDSPAYLFYMWDQDEPRFTMEFKNGKLHRWMRRKDE